MPVLKKEVELNATNRRGQTKYAKGSLIALDLYGHGNYFEARVESYSRDSKLKVEFLHQSVPNNVVDLRTTPYIELIDQNILDMTSFRKGNSHKDGNEFLGRRLIVESKDGNRFSGMVAKTLQDKHDFVFVSFDDGDKVWFHLDPHKEENKPKAKVKATHGRNDGIDNPKKRRSPKKISRNVVSQSKFKAARQKITRQYPVGSRVAIDVYHDGNYHDCTIQEYQKVPSKADICKGRVKVRVQYVHELEEFQETENVDLSLVRALKLVPRDVLTLSNKFRNENEKGFLGRHITVRWQDGIDYRGLVTKCLKKNKNFVFIEYEDGDRCWRNLESDGTWTIDRNGPGDSCDAKHHNANVHHRTCRRQRKTSRKTYVSTHSMKRRRHAS